MGTTRKRTTENTNHTQEPPEEAIPVQAVLNAQQDQLAELTRQITMYRATVATLRAQLAAKK